ncbi:MAG: pantoate--beta-alanine ligase [Flavitalea sp.]
MIVTKHQYLLNEYLEKERAYGLTTGFVPTMGALHAGHMQLVEIAAEQSAITVCSIFINPTQFNDKNDFTKYPQTFESDIHLLEPAATDFLFIPLASEIYPSGTDDLEHYDLGFLETILEGQYRPGHFQGVCQVMKRLLDMVQPDLLFMGQKDYQQCMVLEKLIGLLNIPVQLIRCPTLREFDGLAMSSRNTRLNEEQRQKAPAIFETLNWIKEQYLKGDLQDIKKQAAGILNDRGFRVDYVEVANANSLELLTDPMPGRPAVALIAAFLGEVRLIDNILLS